MPSRNDLVQRLRSVRTEANRDVERRLDSVGKQSSSSLVKTSLWILQKLVIAAIDISIGIALFFVAAGLKLYALWPLFYYGLFLLFLRWLILLFCPILLDLTIPIVDIINIVVRVANKFMPYVVQFIDLELQLTNQIIDIINDADELFGGHGLLNFQFPMFRWPGNIGTISPQQFHDIVKALPPTCARFNSFPKIAAFFMRYGLHKFTCPVVRFLWPLPTFYAIVEALIGWTYYGSADPDPFSLDMNCRADEGITTPEMICAGMGIGYLFLEFFLPCVLAFIFFLYLGRGLFLLFRVGVRSFILAVEIFVDTVSLVFDVLSA